MYDEWTVHIEAEKARHPRPSHAGTSIIETPIAYVIVLIFAAIIVLMIASEIGRMVARSWGFGV